MLTGVTSRLTAGEVAREPRLLHVVAWFDGWARGSGSTARTTFPRRLTRSEAREWRAGFREGQQERRCLTVHGFSPCPREHGGASC